MSEDTTRTDILPWREEPSPSATQVLHTTHRARRGAPIHRAAVIAVFGAPAAAVMLTVGLLLPGWVAGDDDTPARVATPPTAGGPSSSLDPVVPPPVPTRSRADRSRPRDTHPPAPAPSTPRGRSSSPAPKPIPTPTSPPPRPSSPSPSGTGSSGSPTPTTTVTLLPSPEVSG